MRDDSSRPDEPFDFDFGAFSCIFSRSNNETLLQTELDLMHVKRPSHVSVPAEKKSFNWPKALSKPIPMRLLQVQMRTV